MFEDAIRQVIRSHSDHWINLLVSFCRDPVGLQKFLPESGDGLTCSIHEPTKGVFELYVTASQVVEVVDSFCTITDFPFLAAEFALETLTRSTGIRSWYRGTEKIYGLNTRLLEDFYLSKTLGNASFGERYLVNNLPQSVAEITIIDGQGEQYAGSGVVVAQGSPYIESHRILTCKHNLYSEAGHRYEIQSINVGNETFEAVNIFICQRIDVCMVVLDRTGTTVPLPYGSPHILSPVITAGFPRVSLFEASPLLLHRGEINGCTGEVELGTREMIVSCDVAPGNSGGPVLSEFGAILGLVHEITETASRTGMAKYGKAIPIDQILAELKSGVDSDKVKQDYIGRQN